MAAGEKVVEEMGVVAAENRQEEVEVVAKAEANKLVGVGEENKLEVEVEENILVEEANKQAVGERMVTRPEAKGAAEMEE